MIDVDQFVFNTRNDVDQCLLFYYIKVNFLLRELK